MIAQGKASLRALPWVNRAQNFQALKGRQNARRLSSAGVLPTLSALDKNKTKTLLTARIGGNNN